MAATIAKYYFRFRICWCRCLQKIKVYQESKFRRHNSIYGWNITTSVFEKQTSVILEFYFAVIGVSFCIWLPSFVQFGTYAAEIWRHIDIRMAAVSHVLSPRLLAEPWRQEERCARAGSKWESTPLCLQQLHQFVQLVRISISTRCDQSSVRTYADYNVTAIPSPRCVRSSRQRTSQTRCPPALSCRDERHENSNSKHEQEAECHTLHTPTYILVSFSPSAQGTLPRPNTRIPSPEKATDLYIVGP